MVISRSARAKINLHLHMTGRRDDGYHFLDSLVAFTDLTDTIEIHAADDFRLSVQGEFQDVLQSASPDADNLVTRAVMAMAEHYNIAPHMHIHLAKSIPLGAGLGGGSADAAATLLAVCDFWKIAPEHDVLHGIAAQMGSDIAACLSPCPVIMRDTGNKIIPAPHIPACYAVMVNPRTPCPTPLVYKTYAASAVVFSDAASFPESFQSAEDLCHFLNTQTTNDLTDAAISVNPDVKDVLTQLNALPDCLLARMSGSGSTCFAIFGTENISRTACRNLQTKNPDWWVRAVRIS